MNTCWVLGAAVAAVTLTGCGSDGSGRGPGGCTPPVLDGSPFGANGTATLSGAGTLPDGIADGLELQVEVGQGAVSIGVLPENLFAENDRICGKSFSYTVRKLEAGTYRLQFVVFDPNDDSNEIKAVFEGQAPADFTVADGQTLMQDTVFQLKR
jgi:hypothetical protein